jgi:hypothetical protein
MRIQRLFFFKKWNGFIDFSLKVETGKAMEGERPLTFDKFSCTNQLLSGTRAG